MHGGLGQVCATRTYRSTEHVRSFQNFKLEFLLNGKRPRLTGFKSTEAQSVSGKKKLQIQKCPDTCGWGLKSQKIVDCRMWTRGTMQTVD